MSSRQRSRNSSEMSPEMGDLYLVLHKVRGQPAFDVAQRCEDGWGTPSDPAPWWIIPTSGHRAYPADWIPLENCLEGQHMDSRYLPEDLPDHYHASRPEVLRRRGPARGQHDAEIGGLAALGLASGYEPKRRRIV
jgi:hypothetical protein